MTLTKTLTDIQVRILGCLIEKQHTTPEQYPLTLNALKNACNQKTSRSPVVNYYEGEIGTTLNELESMQLVSKAWSARAPKYEHRLPKELDIQHSAVAILCALMLRGPQTAGELRNHTQRIHPFDDIDDVEYVLERLNKREPSMVLMLPKQPGQKEERYVHLLAGEPDLDAIAMPVVQRQSPLEQRVIDLEDQVKQLQARLAALENSAQ